MRFALITICFLFLAPGNVEAQFYDNIYRPTQPEWQKLKTPHFNIIYQQGEDSAAVYTGQVLEFQYEPIQMLVGGELKNLPVVLNGYNDLSNGFVSPFNFRIEVEIPSTKGKGMNPATGGWLEHVLPHELVHALHFSVNPAWGYSSLVNIFSQDLARSVHLISPTGMTEGIAVFHESNVRYERGGRGNYPYFTNRFNANFASGHRWGMGEMHFPPLSSRPFNRHYIGGNEFTHWLQYEYGMEIMHDNITLLARWPFFGYGYSLKRTTGKWPAQLYSDFEKVKEIEEEKRIDSIKALGPTEENIQETHFDGPDLNRPIWFSDNEIIYFGTFYNRRPGFWKLDLSTGKQDQILETRIVEDHWYDVNLDKSTLMYSRYRDHPYYGNTSLMDLYEFDMETLNSKRLTNQERVYAPVYSDEGIWALQTYHETSQWVKVDSAGNTASVLSIRPDNIIEVRPNPQTDEIAVVANRSGVQALWLVESDNKEITLEGSPMISLPGASIFDATWSSDGSKLLFSADYGNVMNLFEYDVLGHRIMQVTNSLFNAFEGSYSPDGARIAYIIQDDDYRKLAIREREDFINREISTEIWEGQGNDFQDHSRLAEHLDDQSGEWERETFRTGLRWLRPKAILPAYEEASGQMGHRFGASLMSGDVLRRNSYQATISTSNNRLWYDASYRYSGFFPGFRVNTYNTPTPTTNFLFEERGAGIEIPIDITTESNTRFSGFSVIPGLHFAEIRAINNTGTAITEWGNATTGSFYTAYNHRLQQNIRDVQPNTGAVIYALNELRFSDDSSTRSFRAGTSVYSSPLRRYNQSLQFGADVLVQGQPGIRTAGFASEGFSENVLAGLNNAYSLRARYTIPLWYPNRSWLLLPVQVNHFYAVAFSNTVGSLTEDGIDDFYSQSRSVYGLGLRMSFGLFNARFDIGVAFGYEPTRYSVNPFVGAF
ncbi:MAG: hypothetical protein WD038_10910 [Balneolales bacterium]